LVAERARQTVEESHGSPFVVAQGAGMREARIARNGG
jgi:hypothetical protein